LLEISRSGAWQPSPISLCHLPEPRPTLAPSRVAGDCLMEIRRLGQVIGVEINGVEALAAA
jgi:hypothetical protein